MQATFIQHAQQRVLLFYSPKFLHVAREVQSTAPEHIELGSMRLKDGKWPTFADGWPNLFIDDHSDIMRRDVVFLASLDEPERVFEELAVIFALSKYRARNYKVIVPWFPTGTMERISEPGEIATASTMARLLSAIPPCATGPAVLSIIDIHALQEQFYFGDGVLVELKTAMGLLFPHVRPDDVIAFPDDGAQKRYKGIFQKLFRKQWSEDLHSNYETYCESRMVVCAKQRRGDERIVVVKEGWENIQGKRIIIVDDMVQSGGTILKCAQVLRTMEAETIDAFVTHGVFPNESWRRFLSDDVDHFFVTDSLPQNVRLQMAPDKFTLLSIASIVGYLALDTKNTTYDAMIES